MARPPIHRVSEWEIRKIFNEKILPRIEAKEVLETVVSEGIPNPENEQPLGTVSEMVAYWEVGGGKWTQLATAHRYRLPDGTIGASGKPDPKELLHEGRLLKPEFKQPRKKGKRR